jgi:hypothetical protein
MCYFVVFSDTQFLYLRPMNIVRNAAAAWLSTLFFIACETPAPTREEKIAGAYCECMSRLVQLNRDMSEQVAKDTGAQTMILFQELEEAYEQAKECSGTIIGQFGKLKPEALPAIEKILVNQCPELAAQRDLLQEMLGE